VTAEVDLRWDTRHAQGSGRTAAHCPACCACRRHPAPPLAGHRSGRWCVPAPDNGPWCRPRGSLTYRATVEGPARFRKSKAVGAVFDVLQVSIGW